MVGSTCAMGGSQRLSGSSSERSPRSACRTSRAERIFLEMLPMPSRMAGAMAVPGSERPAVPPHSVPLPRITAAETPRIGATRTALSSVRCSRAVQLVSSPAAGVAGVVGRALGSAVQATMVASATHSSRALASRALARVLIGRWRAPMCEKYGSGAMGARATDAPIARPHHTTGYNPPPTGRFRPCRQRCTALHRGCAPRRGGPR